SFIIYHFSFFILTFSFLDLFWFGFNYNPIGKVKDWHAFPPTAEFLKEDTSDYRIFSPLSSFVWNKIFENRGWQGDASEYLTFKNMVAPDMNLLWNIPTIEFYSGIAPERIIYLQSLLVDTFQVLDHAGQKELLIADSTLRMLNLLSVKYIVTPGIINHPDFELVFRTNLPQKPNYNIYQNLTVWPQARVVYGYEQASSIEDAGVKLLDPNFDPTKKVILEQDIDLRVQQVACDSRVEITKNENNLVELGVRMKDNGILVLGDTFYPGWKALVNGQEKEIIPANINQRAVILPKGEYKVEFNYNPASFKAGLALTAFSWLGFLGGFVYEKRTD
ncbi:MAG: hypothetical protein FJ044_05835, partial [Candidatus Cloacimonetes bacterium]|nr:hypothetical protein [Candidatus Cloacimonadota bacterium]